MSTYESITLMLAFGVFIVTFMGVIVTMVIFAAQRKK
ncbi:hypothetical protein DQG23_21240 [Paenibacillus contaminans]|uniref:Holin-like toxin n=1 Tax=Paenibacillus contaminans TaxID=450362 RepID=A0A329MI85_9BACL|nr:hypothetical protein DQG23_21240 [Paenibacillus contaminans]